MILNSNTWKEISMCLPPLTMSSSWHAAMQVQTRTRPRTWPYYAQSYAWPKSVLYPVLKRERMLRTKKDRENDPSVAFTHTLFNGGVLNIPFQEYHSRILPLLEADYHNRCYWSISEKVDPLCFPMYMDLDSEEHLTKDVFQTLVDTYHKIVFQYYPQESDIKTVVCMKDAEDPSKGVHVITPSILLNIERASHICEHLRIEMLNSFPDVNWIKIVDTSVYTKGLRMCYNYKCKDCPDCIKEFNEFKACREQFDAAIKSIDEHIEKKKAFYLKKKIDCIKNSHLINDFDIANPERLKAYPLLPNPHGNGYKLVDNAHVLWSAIRELKIEDIGPRPVPPPCDTCNGERRLFSPSEYIPMYQLFVTRDAIENPTLVEFQGSVLDGLILTSLRRDRDEHSMTEPFTHLSLPGFQSTAAANMRKRVSAAGDGHDMASNKRSKTNPLVTIQDPTDPRLPVIQDFLRTTRPQYRFITVRRFTLAVMASVEKQNEKRLNRIQKDAEELFEKISYNTRLPDYHIKVWASNELERVHRIFVEVTGIGCHFCHNKQAEHTNSMVKFELTDDGQCFQRCYSTKKPPQSTIACNEYRQFMSHIPPEVMSVLFPMPTLSILDMNVRKARGKGKGRGTKVPLLSGTILTRQGIRAALALNKRYMDYVIETTGAELARRQQQQAAASSTGSGSGANRRAISFFDDEAEETGDEGRGFYEELSNLEI